MKKVVDIQSYCWLMAVALFVIHFFTAVSKNPLCMYEGAIDTMVISHTVTPLVVFLLTRLFAFFYKKDNILVLPRWLDLLFVYAAGYGLSLFFLLFSSHAYWIAVMAIFILAMIFVLYYRTAKRIEQH